MKNEIWKPIKGFEGLYEVSSLGNVRNNTRLKVQRPVGPKNYQYNSVDLCKNNKRVRLKTHILVLSTFLCERPKGKNACHNNGNRFDNSIENLRWDTHRNNCADKKAHGTALIGERHHQAKITEQKAIEIKKLLNGKLTYKEIAAKVGVSKPIVANIAINKTWKHVSIND